MITKRATLAFAIMAGFGLAAAPAQAQETNAAAAVGAIDMSKVAQSAQPGDDAQFQQLFAKWDELDRSTPYVSKAEWFSSYGKFVSIEHGADLQTRFAHMSGITVKAGTRVKKGDVIGYVGSTGRSTGPHLHYEVRIAGKAVNPVPYMVESEAQRAFALATGTGGQGDGDDN